MRWYLSRTGTSEGPFEEHALVEMIRAGHVPEHAHVAPDGGAAWQPIASHPPFASARAPAPPPTAPAAGVQATMAMDGRQIAALAQGSAAAMHVAPISGQLAPGTAQAPAASAAPSASAEVDPRPGEPLPLKKGSPKLPLAGMLLATLAAAFAALLFFSAQRSAEQSEDSAARYRMLAQEPASPRSYTTPEYYARTAVHEEERADEYELYSWLACAGAIVAMLLAFGALVVLLGMQRKVKAQHADVDRIAAARKAAGLDPITGKPPPAPVVRNALVVGTSAAEAWQPQNDADRFVFQAAQAHLEPGEVIRGAGVLFRDAPTGIRVVQFIGFLLGILPGVLMAFVRSGAQQLWWAVPTDRRLMLLRTKGSSWSGAPERKTMGVTSIGYGDVTAVRGMGGKLVIRTFDGRTHAFTFHQSGGLSDAQRFRSGFAGWLEQRVAERDRQAA